jgi:hypothetical protein
MTWDELNDSIGDDDSLRFFLLAAGVEEDKLPVVLDLIQKMLDEQRERLLAQSQN